MYHMRICKRRYAHPHNRQVLFYSHIPHHLNYRAPSTSFFKKSLTFSIHSKPSFSIISTSSRIASFKVCFAGLVSSKVNSLLPFLLTPPFQARRLTVLAGISVNLSGVAMLIIRFLSLAGLMGTVKSESEDGARERK